MGKILGQYLRKSRKSKKLASKKLSEITGISKSFIDYIETGLREPSAETLKKLADTLGESLEVLLNLQVKDSLEKTLGEDQKSEDDNYNISNLFTIDINNLIKIPIVGVVRAGEPVIAEENIIGYSYIEKEKTNGSRIFGLKVRGDSMNMVGIQEGDIVIVKEQPEVYNGEIGLVLINNEEATIKKVYKTDDNITLIPQSTNPEYQPQIYDPRKTFIKILGKVIEARKQF